MIDNIPVPANTPNTAITKEITKTTTVGALKFIFPTSNNGTMGGRL